MVSDKWVARGDAENRPEGRLNLAIQIASLCTTAVVAWLGSRTLHLGRASLSWLAAQAILFAVAAWLWSLAIAFLLYLTVPRQAGEYRLLHSLRTSIVAVWFAPAMLLLARPSPATLLAALALVVTATRLLYSDWRLIHASSDALVAGPARGLFADYHEPSPLVRREFFAAMTVSLALQSAATARMFRHPMTAAALFAMTAASLTLFAMTSEALAPERPRDLPRTLLAVLVTIFLAAGITIGGLHPRYFGFGGGGGDSDERAPEASRQIEAGRIVPPKVAGPGDGTFPGVILRPETKPFARLVEPPPIRGLKGAALSRTYAIPFDGEYWIYRLFYPRPPAKSLEERGSPSELSFSTVDRWPLVMEAHQSFDRSLELTCRAITVDIWNADRYPNTVSIELDALGPQGWVKIGTEPVRSIPDRRGDHIIAAAESIEFPLHSPIHRCRELKAVFLRDKRRGSHSAMIAIDRFVLEP